MGARGKRHLINQEFLYLENSATTERIFWICCSYYQTKCKARCRTVGNTLFKNTHNHNHNNHSEKIKKLKKSNYDGYMQALMQA